MAIAAPAEYGQAPRIRPRASWLERHKATVYIAVGVGLAALYPFFDSWSGLNLMGSWLAIMIFLLLAMGLNIVVGYAGLLDLGYAAFFAIGAYAMALITSPASFFVREGWIPEVFQNFWAALALSWVVAALFGVLLGAPTLRLRGDYLAIVTLGFGEIVPNFFLNADTITNGTKGVNPIARPPTFSVFGHEFAFRASNQDNWYWLTLALGVLTLLMIRRLYDSRLGRAWVAVREDEIAAASMGVNLVKTKLWAFGMGASFAGFAGSISAAAFQVVSPDQFKFSISVTILAMVILGGLGNIYGVIFGGIIIASFDRILADKLTGPMNDLGERIEWNWLATHNLGSDKLLVFGLALLLMMMLRPEGLLPSARRKAELHEDDGPEPTAGLAPEGELRA